MNHGRHTDAEYQQLFPYYAELCALSEIKKKSGFGVPLQSGMGGHSLLYLHGVARDRTAGYPVLQLADPAQPPQGVGISVNSHYRNANWVAADGPDFLWRGALAAGEPLTRDAYERTQALAKSAGFLDGIEFHEKFLRDKPPAMAEQDFMYEISIGTDYAACFGRNVFRACVPLSRAQMQAIITYLNNLNAPYRAREKIWTWKLFTDNCAHVAHNALAEAGIWQPWPTGQSAILAAFKFPVPKNELVDLIVQTNDLPITHPNLLCKDPMARQATLTGGRLPTGPGALVIADPAIRPNEAYDIDRLRLIFYDNPFWGPYRPRLKRILSEPRYRDLRANFAHFKSLYAQALRNASGNTLYRRVIEEASDRLEHLCQKLDAVSRDREKAMA
jgi:hypothetical protein